jgi:hypothetical protein
MHEKSQMWAFFDKANHPHYRLRTVRYMRVAVTARGPDTGS